MSATLVSAAPPPAASVNGADSLLPAVVAPAVVALLAFAVGRML